MEDDSHKERLNLSKALSTQAGMICEDASAKAVLVGNLGSEQLEAIVAEVRQMLGEAEILAAAAAVLLARKSY